MSAHDSIGDFLTIIRNASAARQSTCTSQWSKVREGIAGILKEEGYIADYRTAQDSCARKTIEITLKYSGKQTVITGLRRMSTPGRRIYYGYSEIPRVLNGLGVSILTTSKGIMKDHEARRRKLGGELLCQVW